MPVMQASRFQYQQKVEPLGGPGTGLGTLEWLIQAVLPIRRFSYTAVLAAGSAVAPFSPALLLDNLAWYVPATFPSRRTFSPAGFLVSPFLPPIRRVGAFEDKIVVGQNQSIATGMQPAIGGGQTW